MYRLSKQPDVLIGATTGIAVAIQMFCSRNGNTSFDRARAASTVQSSTYRIVAVLSSLHHASGTLNLLRASPFARSCPICNCEERDADPEPRVAAPDLSRFRRRLAAAALVSLPLPRRIQSGDPVFDSRHLRRGLQKRRRDEQALRGLQKEAIAARNSRDPTRIQDVFAKISEIAYGKGVTPQIREDFVIQYGCTGWTQDVLETIVKLAETRGIVEIGAGHGQWARALSEYYEEAVERSSPHKRKKFEFVLAYDNMEDLPLSTHVYHAHTQAAHDYFYSSVQKCSNAETVLRQWSCRGRVLLLVYPPPGRMAIETIRAYTAMCPENDTVLLVSEGRGGANGNDDLFAYLENGEWDLLGAMHVKAPPGGKGYEELFILKRRLEVDL